MKYSFTKPQPVNPLIVGTGTGTVGPKTVMIAGLPRGGTSATAAVIDALGVPVGNTEDGHYEFPEFKADPFSKENWSIMEDRIRSMNAAHECWGTQVWYEIAPIYRIGSAIRNPHLVLVFRDLAALMQRCLLLGEYATDVHELLLLLTEEQSRLWHVARNRRFPTLLISFERLRTTPDVTVRHIAEFLRLDASEAQIVDAMNRVNRRGGYIMQQVEGYREE